MIAFEVGDRVRVLSTPRTTRYAGRTGAVAWGSPEGEQAAFSYHVRLDADRSASTAAVYVSFQPDELEPESTMGGGGR
jgi:hypothetical protein